MRWKKRFYQDEHTDRYNDFYHSQREATVILEEVKKLKSGLYLAKVVDIISDEDFRIMGQAGGCTHQFHIGEEFKLRKHKYTVCGFLEAYWFDVRYPGRFNYEDFVEIKE